MCKTVNETGIMHPRILVFIKTIEDDGEPSDVVELFKQEVIGCDADVISLNAILNIARQKSPHYKKRQQREQTSLLAMVEHHCDS